MSDAEHVVLTLRRGERGELRLARYRFKGNVGTKLQFWYPGDDDELKPGKCVTLRDDELGEVVGALQRIARRVGSNGDAANVGGKTTRSGHRRGFGNGGDANAEKPRGDAKPPTPSPEELDEIF